MASRYELEQELKKARKAVLTLGLSLVPYKMLFEDASQADKGFSFAGTVFGYTFRVLWFLLWLVFCMTIIWFINIFKWIYYAIVLSKGKTKRSTTMPHETQPQQPQQRTIPTQVPIRNTAQKSETQKSKSGRYIAIAIKLIVIVCLVIFGITFYVEHKKNVNISQEAATVPQENDETEYCLRNELLSNGYVDLGLPSGTLWKRTNEEGYYTYNQAKQKFGDKLPTKDQWEELIKYCSWQWSGWKSNNEIAGYYVTAKNGVSIFLPNMGWTVALNNYSVCGRGQSGNYWSSTNSEKGLYTLSLYRTYCNDHTQEEDRISMYEFDIHNDSYKDNEYSVRLVY